MHKSQEGLGWFGFLIMLAIAVAVGYYAYKGIWETEEQPLSCAAALNGCIKQCRRTATEADEEHRCQEACQRESDACTSAGR
jgi:hypothetical protein